jgi:hypothetical protein
MSSIAAGLAAFGPGAAAPRLLDRPVTIATTRSSFDFTCAERSMVRTAVTGSRVADRRQRRATPATGKQEGFQSGFQHGR